MSGRRGLPRCDRALLGQNRDVESVIIVCGSCGHTLTRALSQLDVIPEPRRARPEEERFLPTIPEGAWTPTRLGGGVNSRRAPLAAWLSTQLTRSGSSQATIRCGTAVAAVTTDWMARTLFAVAVAARWPPSGTTAGACSRCALNRQPCRLGHPAVSRTPPVAAFRRFALVELFPPSEAPGRAW